MCMKGMLAPDAQRSAAGQWPCEHTRRDASCWRPWRWFDDDWTLIGHRTDARWGPRVFERRMAAQPVMYRYLTAWCLAASILERSRLAEPLSAWQRNVSLTEGGFYRLFPDIGFVPLPSRRS
ncbi:uncharacterized protein BDZ83DRAFT_652652 [Colletotrichum acutatum]|uniref:Uncharacterized protein n=1 Tax=Glomerella acutata TaxID=27357 RepID=A0AAD8UP99_GLOAC|nr:uncharacterized protein BDZ83DRAFT_652652 [Colletotrichum acutatum]KAK1723955.1 hypothetical protein BDZ83DRAFT_652652 [Colletotrichum acutatum]